MMREESSSFWSSEETERLLRYISDRSKDVFEFEKPLRSADQLRKIRKPKYFFREMAGYVKSKTMKQCKAKCQKIQKDILQRIFEDISGAAGVSSRVPQQFLDTPPQNVKLTDNISSENDASTLKFCFPKLSIGAQNERPRAFTSAPAKPPDGVFAEQDCDQRSTSSDCLPSRFGKENNGISDFFFGDNVQYLASHSHTAHELPSNGHFAEPQRQLFDKERTSTPPLSDKRREFFQILDFNNLADSDFPRKFFAQAQENFLSKGFKASDKAIVKFLKQILNELLRRHDCSTYCCVKEVCQRLLHSKTD